MHQGPRRLGSTRFVARAAVCDDVPVSEESEVRWSWIHSDLHDQRGGILRFLTVRAMATVLLRAAQISGARLPLMGHILKTINHLLTGADIAWDCKIGPGLRLYHPTGVVIGPDVQVGSNCEVQSSATLGASRERGSVIHGRVDSPILGNDVLVGTGARVLGPIRVGNGAVLAANAVVIRDVPEGALCAGVPGVNRSRGI